MRRVVSSIVAACFLVPSFLLSEPVYAQLDEIVEALRDIHIQHPDAGDLKRKLEIGINRVIQEELDPYTEYHPMSDVTDPLRNDGTHRGLGISIMEFEEQVILVPHADSPLYAKGFEDPVKALHINGASIAGRSKEEVQKRLASALADPIVLEVQRIGAAGTEMVEIFAKTMRYATAELMNVRDHRYLRIYDFVEGRTVEDLKIHIAELDKDEQLILDLRFSGGGDLYAAVDAASLFLAGGFILATLDDGVSRSVLKSLPEAQRVFSPALILTSRQTASSAEVFVQALKIYAGAYQVGGETVGKCFAQTRVPLSDGGTLVVTNRRILWPGGDFCDGQGIMPDIQFEGLAVLETEKLISAGIRKLQRPLSYICVSDPLNDPIQRGIAAQEIELSMNIDGLRFYEMEREAGTLLCLGPLVESAIPEDIAANWSEKMARPFHVEFD